MELLLTLDEKNYHEDMPVFEKQVARAIIVRDGRLAMQRCRKGEYKIPGGGVEPGESRRATLIREVREETGLLVMPETITEIGEVLEVREDVFSKGTKYICHTYYYQCQVEAETVEPELTECEREKGYEPVWEIPEVIVRENRRLQAEKPWRGRDTEFLARVISGEIKVRGL
ncbi:MAG: NUDIX domain-containing protein [Lachnospiraceae bacterium]|nr:NUDIX domain-containing protein [Lachnospiraceae bacterium]